MNTQTPTKKRVTSTEEVMDNTKKNADDISKDILKRYNPSKHIASYLSDKAKQLKIAPNRNEFRINLWQ